MYRKLLDALSAWIVPSRHNDYHPHLLAERGLLVLFAAVLATEAFLVSNVVSAEPGPPPLASVSLSGMRLGPGLSVAAAWWNRIVIAPLSSLAVNPNAGRLAFFALLGIVAVLMGLLALTLAHRRRRHLHVEYIAGGTMLLFAATMLFADTHALLPGMAATRAQPAAAAAPLALPVSGSNASSKSSAVSTPTSTPARQGV